MAEPYVERPILNVDIETAFEPIIKAAKKEDQS
jgi:hypothetical protein